MSSFFSSDGPFSLQFAIIFAIIFAVLAAGVLVMRRFTGQGPSLSGKTGTRGRQPRLGIVDIYELDRQRQLILLRRDNVEHLLLVGGPNDVVVERNITRGISAHLAAEETAYDELPEPVREAPAAVPYRTPDLHVPTEPATQAAPVPVSREPSFEMPVVIPAPASVSAPPPAARPLDLPPRTVADDSFRPAPPVDTAQRRESPFARVIRRAPPSLVNLVPASFADRVKLPDPQPVPIPEKPAPVVTPPAVRGIDAAILSDMARQLEEALRRPSAAVRPALPAQPEAVAEPVPEATSPEVAQVEPVQVEPVQVEPIQVEPVPAEPPTMEPEAPASQSVDPIAAAMAATAEPAPAQESEPRKPDIDDALFRNDPPEPLQAEPDRTQPVFIDPPPTEPMVAVSHPTEALPDAEPVIRDAVADAPRIEEPAPAETAPPPAAAPDPEPISAPAPKPSASPNPFSVEEIEAEFARLLGRPLDRKL